MNGQGVLESTTENRAEVLEQIRQELDRQARLDEWVAWGRWFLADPASRNISPFSAITLADYVQDRIDEKTLESLYEARCLASGNTNQLHRISYAVNRKTRPRLS